MTTWSASFSSETYYSSKHYSGEIVAEKEDEMGYARFFRRGRKSGSGCEVATGWWFACFWFSEGGRKAAASGSLGGWRWWVCYLLLRKKENNKVMRVMYDGDDAAVANPTTSKEGGWVFVSPANSGQREWRVCVFFCREAIAGGGGFDR